MSRFNYKRAPRGKTTPPWKATNIKLEKVILEKKKSEYTEAELHQRAMEKIEEMGGEIEIYTDGSTSGRQERGGSGVYIRNRDGEVLLESSSPAGEICSSYRAEGIALTKALDYMLEHQKTNYVVITDSISLCSALESNNWRDRDPILSEIKQKCPI